MLKLKILIIIILLNVYSSYSSDTSAFQNEVFAIHPKAGIIGVYYSSDFIQFQGAADCGLFQSGYGLNYKDFWLVFEIPMSEYLHIGIGASLVDRSGILSLNDSFQSYDTTKREVVSVFTENSIRTKLEYFDIQTEFKYILADKLVNGPLRFVTAFRVGIPLKATFEQKEKITSPENAVFVIDNRRTQERLVSSGDIRTIYKPALGITAGFENMLKLSKHNFLTQQLLFDYNVTNVTTDAYWRTMSLRFEVGLRFSIQSTPEPELKHEKPKEPAEPVFAEKNQDSVSSGKLPLIQTPILKAKIKDLDLELHTGNELLASAPIVNAVFFDRNSAQIPSNYILSNQENMSFFLKDPVEIHNYILPRIAEIVNKNPNSKIVLEGGTSGNQYEPDGLSLSLKRTETVKKALLNLGIPENKITLAPRLIPRIQSNQEFEKGVEENQRVDIIVRNAPLQEFVNIQKYAELHGRANIDVDFQNLDEVILTSNMTSESLKAHASGTYDMMIRQRIENEYEPLTIQINASSDTINASDKQLFYPSSFPKRQIELNLDNFEAVLRFDYNSSNLSDDNKNLLKQMCDLLPSGSSILIYGSTDALGTEQRNIQLEKERAKITEQYIKSYSGIKFNISTSSGIQKYTEFTPQGRFLNRCIRIKVNKKN